VKISGDWWTEFLQNPAHFGRLRYPIAPFIPDAEIIWVPTPDLFQQPVDPDGLLDCLRPVGFRPAPVNCPAQTKSRDISFS
jgi:hypothetical protein